MSTTVTINPSSDGNGVVPIVAAGVSAVGALLAAVLTDDAECRKMLETARGEMRADRFARISLQTPDLSRLAQGAREANFSVRETKDWLRIDVPGQRDPVWAARTPEGIAIVGGAQAAQRVSVANTMSRLTQALTDRGATVQRAFHRAGGRDVDFVARTAGNKELKISLTSSGEAVVDAVNHRGSECDQVARDLAAAMEGTITSFSRKPEYFGSAAVRIGGKQNV